MEQDVAVLQPGYESSKNVLQRVTDFFADLMERYLPDPFVLVIVLTLVMVVLGMTVVHQSLGAMVNDWSTGFWSFLEFSMQVALVVVTGYALAASKPVARLFNWVASRFHTPRGAILCVTVVAACASYISWGFGLIAGALMAQELAKRIRGVHYPLLFSSAYSGWIVYGLGISATIPITLATAGNPFAASIGGLVSLKQTIFLPGVLIDVGILLVTLPILNLWIHPKASDVLDVNPAAWENEEQPPQPAASSPAAGLASSKRGSAIGERLERAWPLNAVIALMGIGYLVYHFWTGGSLDINTLNAIFLFAGLLCHGTPMAYVQAVSQGVRSIGGIVLQFPFYAGIMGMMQGSGLAVAISKWMVNLSTAHTLPFFGFLSSFIINFFAPSSGGHWAIQGPFMIEAAKHVGASIAKTSMAVQMGCSWNDLVQPFWLIPILSVARLNVRQIMGYTIVPFLWVGVVYAATVLLW
ncbi:short-chain fatty acid transporter [Alicyclobacillus cycloheptanicus]|uniref:Short-chain fatty acids transporter n=1 Tax=Alicyclobacillus cycloheptanicus TaxID=1457 RepID=A0ABT9XFJ8_9BACL|nr:TIGR00366 family protein [Alicyclobacillus cycloheptanicus]MDQ0189074.1 short-chain fatty acids transporter [Alicyclobacillus cycloheptanicus]WDM00209.1 short-chain fatty acid transporter [Alicyclobacillus cycloheptanicus]